MKGIKISACIITYNQEDYIKSCLDGAISQVVDYDYEIVIGDDCSTDNTLKICKEYAERHPDKIRLLSRGKNMGMAANWADTILNCQGKYIAICEGDDYWTDKNKLQQQVDFLESNPDYALTFHKVSVLKADGELVEDFLTDVPAAHETLDDVVERGNYIHTPSIVFRNLIKEFPPEFFKSPIADHFLYVLLAKHGKVKYLEDDMAVYRHGVGVLTSQGAIKITTNLIRFYSCLLSYFQEDKYKAIILERQNMAIERLLKNSEYQLTRNKFLSEKKSSLDLVRITIRKIFKIK